MINFIKKLVYLNIKDNSMNFHTHQEIVKRYWDQAVRSMMKTKSEFAGIGPIALLPYAVSDGHTTFIF